MEEEEDEESKPVIVSEVVVEKPSNDFKIGLNADGSGWTSKVSQNRKTDLGKRRRDGEDDDRDHSQRRRNDDLSPPRKRNDDLSPPRKRNDDLSPPRKRNDDLSPPRKRNNDLSPPRKRNQDLSPPRKRDRDLSPPRRKDRDLSPPRKRNNKDLSPPRRKQRHDSVSPPRRRQRHDSVSPPRRQTNESRSPPRRQRHDSRSPVRKEENVPLKQGLITGSEIAEETARIQRQQDAKFAKENPDTLGKGAGTVYRDKRGKKLSINEVIAVEEGRHNSDEDLEWGSGLAQKRQKEEKKYEATQKNKPFARSIDDQDLNAMYKEKARWGDPMAGRTTLKSETKKEEYKTETSKRPYSLIERRWKGVPPVNRYNIIPGNNWDGLDRSNGFEKKLLFREGNKVARDEEAYLYSVEDM
eukprot:TRINITY_DN902_c0_g1_i6.p1 TRINITY_DN902_c0_g1~~TRINITY_DN902_c0_g1_i6.p1  ORF type:complete len:473 (+),score=133.12 TRINITY_DN902_c0_g1_i6:189-1421(+)